MRQWLQIKGDPTVRECLFQQTRVETEFDRRIDHLIAVVEELLTYGGVFHVAIHFSSNQLTCWRYQDPYRYEVTVGESVFALAPQAQLSAPAMLHKPAIPETEIGGILREFRRLRFQDANIYLRSGSINIINGVIGLSFSCDGSHYIPYEQFCRAVPNMGCH